MQKNNAKSYTKPYRNRVLHMMSHQMYWDSRPIKKLKTGNCPPVFLHGMQAHLRGVFSFLLTSSKTG